MSKKCFSRARISCRTLLTIAGLAVGVVLGLGPTQAEAARTILGQIKDESGNPVRGLLVKAWDDDSSSDNDFMGQSYTDADGRYRIAYRGG